MDESVRLRALRNISANLPAGNTRLASGLQAARDMQMQQFAAKAPTTAAITPMAQQAGAQLATQAGQESLALQQQAAQQQQQLQQQALQQQQMAAQAEQATLQAAAENQKIQNIQRFSNLSEQAKKELLDSRLQFSRDEAGRQFLNERQLGDFAVLQAKNREELANYVQRETQAHERKKQTLQHAMSLIEQQLKQEYLVNKKIADQLSTAKQSGKELGTTERLAQQSAQKLIELETEKRIIESSILQDIANQEAKAAKWGMILGVAGAVGGGIAGGPGGAQAGYGVGSGVGTMAAAQ